MLAATGLFFMIQRGVFAKKKIDPAELLAQLEKSGVLIERDTRSPDQPVTSLNFFGGDIPPGVLDQLGVFPQLQKLIFGGTKMSDVQLEHLEDLTSLRVLNLSNTKVTGGGMQFLKKLVNLEELNVNQTLVTDAGLNQLKGLTKLKRLIVTGSLAKGLELEAAIPGLKVTRD